MTIRRQDTSVYPDTLHCHIPIPTPFKSDRFLTSDKIHINRACFISEYPLPVSMSTFTNVNVHFFTRPYFPAPSRVWHKMLRLSRNMCFAFNRKLCIYDHFIPLEKFRFSLSKHRAKILSYNMLGLRKNPPFFSNTFSLLSVSEKRALSAITLPVAIPSNPSEPCDVIPS